jgi:predicted methyltransferase
MLKSVPYLAPFIVAAFLFPVSAHADTQSGAVRRALADPRRPAHQVSLDATRKPAQLLAFAQLREGGRVADFMPGNAYFTRIMSAMVGAAGHVYAFLPTEQLANCPPREIAGTRSLEHDPSYANVSILSGAAANFSVPEKLDLIWTAQNYHDLHDAFMGPVDVRRSTRDFSLR